MFTEAESSLADDERLAQQVFESNLLNNIGGELFVHEIELPGQLELASGTDVPFFRLPFAEAIEHFLARRIITPEEFQTLSDAERNRAFTVSRASSLSLIAKIKKALYSTMADESSTATLRTFVKEFKGKADGFTANYVENVFRTTTAASYNSGRKRAQESEVVANALPFLQYVTAGDSRVSDYCEPYHLRVWPAREFPQEIYPPNHFRCRSVVVSRTAEQAARFPSGLGVRGATRPQDGFAAPPDAFVRQEAGVDGSTQPSVGAR